MKSIRTSAQAANLNMSKQNANIGCNVCPCCGETKDSFNYFAAGKSRKGLLRGLQKTWVEGLFKMKNMKCDCYKCLTCGAEWESEPYEW